MSQTDQKENGRDQVDPAATEFVQQLLQEPIGTYGERFPFSIWPIHSSTLPASDQSTTTTQSE